MKKIVWVLGLFLFGVVGYAVYFLNAAMPTATGYTAKYVCSQVFLAGRDPVVVYEMKKTSNRPTPCLGR